MKFSIVLKHQDANGLGGDLLEAMGMTRSEHAPTVFTRMLPMHNVEKLGSGDNSWSQPEQHTQMYVEALADYGIRPMRVFQKHDSTAGLTPLHASAWADAEEEETPVSAVRTTTDDWNSLSEGAKALLEILAKDHQIDIDTFVAYNDDDVFTMRDAYRLESMRLAKDLGVDGWMVTRQGKYVYEDNKHSLGASSKLGAYMDETGRPRCDMELDCEDAVTHIDSDGYIYCPRHAARRKSGGMRVRKLRPVEMKKLLQTGVAGSASSIEKALGLVESAVEALSGDKSVAAGRSKITINTHGGPSGFREVYPDTHGQSYDSHLIDHRNPKTVQKAAAYALRQLQGKPNLTYEEVIDFVHETVKNLTKGRWTYVKWNSKSYPD